MKDEQEENDAEVDDEDHIHGEQGEDEMEEMENDMEDFE